MESPLPTVRLAFYSIQPEDCETEKPPIIFLHGSTASKEYWNDIPRKVANVTKRKVFAVDLRNHGDSEWSDDCSVPNYVDDVLQFMNSIKSPKAIFVGHSLGGRIAMKIALMANERVEKIALEDIPVSKLDNSIADATLPYVSLNQSAIQELPIGLDEDEAKKFIADYVHNGYPTELKELFHKIIQSNPYNGILKPTGDGRYTLKTNMDAIRKSLLEYKDTLPELVGVYEGPSCFIYGLESSFNVDKDEDNIKKHFPNAEVVGIEKATHFVHTDCPQEFTEALLKFL